jgi:hypothetical protein
MMFSRIFLLVCIFPASYGWHAQASLTDLKGREASAILEALSAVDTGSRLQSHEASPNAVKALSLLLLAFSPYMRLRPCVAQRMPMQSNALPRPLGVHRTLPVSMAETVVVMDGTDSFSESRGLFLTLHATGKFEAMTAVSSSSADARKLLLSRQARNAGVVEVLNIVEGSNADLGDIFSNASSWIVVNADKEQLLEQVSAASKAGIKRAFIHIASSEASIDMQSVTDALVSSSMEYSVMRTGSLLKTGSSAGQVVAEFNSANCPEIPIGDVFSFISEAMTIDEAKGRTFSFCGSPDHSQLTEMRKSGCTRREEVEALLRGDIKERTPEEIEQAEEAVKSDQEKGAAASKPKQTPEEKAAELEQLKKQAIERQRELAEKKKQKRLEEEQRTRELDAKRQKPTSSSASEVEEVEDESSSTPSSTPSSTASSTDTTTSTSKAPASEDEEDGEKKPGFGGWFR